MEYDLIYRNNSGERGVLNKGDDLIGHRWYYTLYYLQESYLEEDLRFSHAQNLTGFLLTPWNTFNAASVNLREIAGVVDNKGKKCRRKSRQQIPAKQKPRTVIYYDKLEKQRSASDDPDQGFHRPAYYV